MKLKVGIHIIKGIDFLSYNKYTKVSVEVAIRHRWEDPKRATQKGSPSQSACRKTRIENCQSMLLSTKCQ